MATTYKDLIAQRDAIEQKIKEAREQEVGDAIERIKGLIEEFDLTAEEVFPPQKDRKTNANAGKKVAAKYRDPESGSTWTGRGKAPRWFDKENLDKYQIK